MLPLLYTSLLDYLNPLKYFTHEEYSSIWRLLFETIFNGFWAKFLSVTFLIISVWLITRRRNAIGSGLCLLISFLFAYFSSIMKILGVKIG